MRCVWCSIGCPGILSTYKKVTGANLLLSAIINQAEYSLKSTFLSGERDMMLVSCSVLGHESVNYTKYSI